ncbi:uncharacterized protein LOC129598280 [Paramacrobiotus metropolitanus]|uniref:uncharacterized protein LOC129598280 n=1 Tax=Paramacrobiotus metropolitanus TaxID=2943436 RepID=UPI002445B7B6|nr:uncharacterized protein LOC129598280 [Paramacrobiotus metropolitanus]
MMDRSAQMLVALVVLYVIIVALGVPQAVGMGLVTTRLAGCPLFSELTSPGFPVPALYGTVHNCNYVTYMPVIISVILGLILFIYHLSLLVQALRRPGIIPAETSAVPFVVISLLGLVLTLIGAGILEAGLYWFCQSNKVIAARFINVPITCVPGEATVALFRGYDPYYDLLTSEVSYWLAVAAWLLAFIFSILRWTALRRERGQGDDLRATTASGQRPGGQAFGGVSLLADKFKKRPVETVTPTKVIPVGQTMAGSTLYETKVKPLETAA